MQRYFFLLILIFLLPLSLSGVEPDEILKDKILEERARIISSDLRCLVCQNENIDSSNADLAKDLRLLVRERLLVGDTNKQVKNFIRNAHKETERIYLEHFVTNTEHDDVISYTGGVAQNTIINTLIKKELIT